MVEKAQKPGRDLFLVAFSILVWGIGEGLFYIFQPLYLQELGADPIKIGLILSINGVGMTVSQIPMGYLADRFGRRPLMWSTWVLGVLSTGIMAFSSSLNLFMVGLFLYGLTSAVLSPMNSYIAAARGSWSVGRAVSFVSAMYNAGAIVGPLLGGFFAQRLGLHVIYKFAAGVFLVSTIIIFFIKPQPVEKTDVRDKPNNLLRNSRFMLSLGMILMIMLAVYLPMPLAANFLQNERGLSLETIGQLGAIANLGNMALALSLGHLPVLIVFILGQAAMALFALIMWQGTGVIWFGVAYFFTGGYRLIRAMTVAMVRPLVHDAQVGLAFGFTEAVNNFAVIIAPLIAGLLYTRNPILMFPVSIGAIGLAMIMNLVVIRINRNNRLKAQEAPFTE